MYIKYASIFVNNQDKALKFYTETLGFVKKQDIPVGEFKWLTVVLPDNTNGTELLLEPNDNPIAQAYQKGVFDKDIPAAAFGVTDIRAEYERLQSLGVSIHYAADESRRGNNRAVFDDTCGNLIQILQANRTAMSNFPPITHP